MSERERSGETGQRRTRAETRKPAGVVRVRQGREQAQVFNHPWNPNSEVEGVMLSRLAGLERTGVSRAVVQPGKESFAYHSHLREEEWIYVLSGRALMTIDGEEIELRPGDFVGFPTPSVAHHLENPFDEPVEYLMGGECRDFEVADFPELNRRMLRRPDAIEYYDLDAGRPISFETDPSGE